jgi:hypothetical protein
MTVKISATGETVQPGNKLNISVEGTGTAGTTVNVTLLQNGSTVTTAPSGAVVDGTGHFSYTFTNVANGSNYSVEVDHGVGMQDQQDVPFGV